jgi:hypothetical protein
MAPSVLYQYHGTLGCILFGWFWFGMAGMELKWHLFVFIGCFHFLNTSNTWDEKNAESTVFFSSQAW